MQQVSLEPKFTETSDLLPSEQEYPERPSRFSNWSAKKTILLAGLALFAVLGGILAFVPKNADSGQQTPVPVTTAHGNAVYWEGVAISTQCWKNGYYGDLPGTARRFASSYLAAHPDAVSTYDEVRTSCADGLYKASTLGNPINIGG